MTVAICHKIICISLADDVMLTSIEGLEFSTSDYPSEINITGTLPEAGNLKLIITRPLPEKSCAAIEGVYTKADRKLSKMH